MWPSTNLSISESFTIIFIFLASSIRFLHEILKTTCEKGFFPQSNQVKLNNFKKVKDNKMYAIGITILILEDLVTEKSLKKLIKWKCTHMHACARMCKHMHECARICTHVHACACMCTHMHAIPCHRRWFLEPMYRDIKHNVWRKHVLQLDTATACELN